MAGKKKNIDQLFKDKLSSREIAPPEEIWEGIDDIMPKKLFFKFRYEHMNIYYCSLIVFCFLFSTVSMVYTIDHVNKHSVSPEVKGSAFDTLVLKDGNTAVHQNDEVDDRNEKKRFGQTGTQKELSSSNTASQESDSLKPIPVDTLAQHTLPQEQKNVPKTNDLPLKKTKKIIYVMDYDTIVNYDTLRTKKKR